VVMGPLLIAIVAVLVILVLLGVRVVREGDV
jgi:hypothetical protein